MPCVFPILSLKALSLARAGIDERHARREGVAYTAGVVLTCVALGAIILALRAGGSAIGWAFQLPDPRMLVGLRTEERGVGKEWVRFRSRWSAYQLKKQHYTD